MHRKVIKEWMIEQLHSKSWAVIVVIVVLDRPYPKANRRYQV